MSPCKLTFDLLTLKVVSKSRVTWATSANFSLPKPLCSRLMPDIRDRQTDVRRASSLNAPGSRGGYNNVCQSKKIDQLWLAHFPGANASLAGAVHCEVRRAGGQSCLLLHSRVHVTYRHRPVSRTACSLCRIGV